jgi:hypothetical protein
MPRASPHAAASAQTMDMAIVPVNGEEPWLTRPPEKLAFASRLYYHA